MGWFNHHLVLIFLRFWTRVEADSKIHTLEVGTPPCQKLWFLLDDDKPLPIKTWWWNWLPPIYQTNGWHGGLPGINLLVLLVWAHWPQDWEQSPDFWCFLWRRATSSTSRFPARLWMVNWLSQIGLGNLEVGKIGSFTPLLPPQQKKHSCTCLSCPSSLATPKAKICVRPKRVGREWCPPCGTGSLGWWEGKGVVQRSYRTILISKIWETDILPSLPPQKI